MKKAAVILFILQAVALVGGIAGKSDVFVINNAGDIATLIGFFLPAIIGIVLFIKAKKKEQSSK